MRVRQLRLASVCSADVAAKWDERLAASGPMPLEAPDTRCKLFLIVSHTPSIAVSQSAAKSLQTRVWSGVALVLDVVH